MNRKAGTEKMGWGRDVKIAHSTVRKVLTLRARITSPTARPSGTLCTARDMEMNWPNFIPDFPPKETPMPMPSESECNVITMTIRIIRCVDNVPSITFMSSNLWRIVFVRRMNSRPMRKPHTVRMIECMD